MDPQDVIHMLNWDLVVILGNEGDKVHMLFYSEVDQDWFVVISDEKVKEIITIFHHTYHNRWNISGESFEKAKALASSGKAEKPVRFQTETIRSANQEPQSIKVTGYARNSDGTMRLIGICNLSISEFGLDLDLLANDPRIHRLVYDRLPQVMRSGESADTFFMRTRNGVPKSFHLEVFRM